MIPATLMHALSGPLGMPGLLAHSPVVMEPGQETGSAGMKMVHLWLKPSALYPPSPWTMAHATFTFAQVRYIETFFFLFPES